MCVEAIYNRVRQSGLFWFTHGGKMDHYLIVRCYIWMRWIFFHAFLEQDMHKGYNSTKQKCFMKYFLNVKFRHLKTAAIWALFQSVDCFQWNSSLSPFWMTAAYFLHLHHWFEFHQASRFYDQKISDYWKTINSLSFKGEWTALQQQVYLCKCLDTSYD